MRLMIKILLVLMAVPSFIFAVPSFILLFFIGYMARLGAAVWSWCDRKPDCWEEMGTIHRDIKDALK